MSSTGSPFVFLCLDMYGMCRRIHAAVFKCLKETESDEVAEKSFQLLTELEKVRGKESLPGLF